ncbi:MAG: hypothetical protein RLZZ453_254 [Chlamydiota bacterium]|jgi:thiamine monophosphate synthase
MVVGKCSIYAIVNWVKFSSKAELSSHIEEVVRGRIGGIRLTTSGLFIERAIEMGQHIKRSLPPSVPLMINDHPDRIASIAFSIEACGVYLDENCNVEELRQQLGSKITIGVAYRGPVVSNAVDYLGVSIYPRKNQPGSGVLWGTELLRRVQDLTKKPTLIETDTRYASCLVPFIDQETGMAVKGLQGKKSPHKFLNRLFDEKANWHDR